MVTRPPIDASQSSPTSADQAVKHAVSELASRTRLPIAFGGLEVQGAIHVSAIQGARTRALDGLVVEASRGLGGQAFVEKRPRLTLDYRSARSITHDYDAAILGEGIATLFAVPIVVSGHARGVLYCGSWGRSPVGEVTQPALAVAGELATELRIVDEVDRRLRQRTPEASALSAAAAETIRDSFAELRRIGAEVDDTALRERLTSVERRLAGLTAEGADSHGVAARLSPRETDVLACVATGASNSEIAEALRLKEVTVKSYLQSVMAKLDATTRHSAVAKARLQGILP